MALDSQSTLAQAIAALAPSMDQGAAVTAFVAVIANFTNKVQAGATGTPGILTFSNSSMKSVLMTQKAVMDSSWVPNFVSAWQAGITSGTIAASTVTDSSWTGSGNKDTTTVTSPATTITNLTAAASQLQSELAAVNYGNQPPADKLAAAVRDATLLFTFNCIGLGPPPTNSPIPKTFTAQ